MIEFLIILSALCFIALAAIIYNLSDNDGGGGYISLFILVFLCFFVFELGKKSGFSSTKPIQPKLKITCDNSHQDSLVCDTVYVYKIEE